MGCGESSLSGEGIHIPQKANQKTERSPPSQLIKTDTYTEPRSATPFERIKNKGRITLEQIENAYDRAEGNLERLFDQMSERISEYYMKLSAEGIEQMTSHRLTQVETKVYLSEQVLLLTLDIMKVIGSKTNYEYNIDVFRFFNRSQSVMINYIKEKYPRAGNIFVPGDLMTVFKQFNMVESPENDLLRNAGICFSDSCEQEIVKKLKQFFNILIDQLDAKYPLFQALLQQRVFTYVVDGKKKTFNYKIGRKLPENTAKFEESDTDELAITSPELFRMIIKWVTDMQQFLDSPEDEVNEKETFKVYSVGKDEVYLDEITPDQFEGLNQTLKSKLKEVNQPFRKSIHNLLREMDMFNLNLLKILYTTERKQKYVPRDEAHVIKFAMYNTKLVSWLMAEKLIMVLKNLITVGIEMEKTEVSRKLDLVKFNVKDLFRAMVIGTKKQTLIVYENLKKLEEEGRIKIIQIRNRLGTPLNDAMIIFTFKQSFVICELQLILSEGQGVSQKVKNIEVLNHFLYELVRSPYGVLSEVAVLLGYKDNKINYEDKISFLNKSFSDFKACEQKHPEAITIQRIQKKPFICTNCTEFYHPFENIFGLKRCEKCFTFQCCRCLFKNSKEVEDNQVNQRFSEQLACLISDERSRKSYLSPLSKQVTIEDIMKCFCKKKFFFKNIFKKHYQKLQPKDIHSFIKHKSYLSQQIEQLQYVEEPYFLLVQFKGEYTSIRCLYWNPSIEEIQSCFDPSQNFYELEKISSSSYDFLIFLNTSEACEYKPEQIEKSMKLSIRPDFPYQNVKKLKSIKIGAKNKELHAILIVKIELSSHLGKVDGGDHEEEEIAAKKEFLFASITEARKSLPSVGLVLQNFQMKNYGITTPLLNDYFSKCKEKLKIKTLNLSNNKINDIQVIVNECSNLEALMVSKNFIKTLNLTKPLSGLSKLVLFSNKISEIKGFNNAPMLKKLNLQNNSLKKLENLNLKNLQEFIISDNQFQSLEWLEKSTLPSLENLLMSNCGLQDTGDDNKSYKFCFPKLKKLIYSSNPTKTLTLECPELVLLECEYNQLYGLNLSSKKIQCLVINSNKLANLGDILMQKAETLKKINASNSGVLKKFPKISSDLLEVLNIENCEIEDIANLQISSLPRLKQLVLNSNKFTTLPVLNLPNLKVFLVSYVWLENIDQLSSFYLPMVEELFLYGNSSCEIQNWPRPTFPALKYLRLEGFNFEKMGQFAIEKLPTLEKLELCNLRLKAFPQICSDRLKNLSISGCQVESFADFNKSMFPILEVLSISSLNTNIRPQSPECRIKAFECPKLLEFYVTYCENFDIEGLLQSKMPMLQRLQSRNCVCIRLPVIKFPNLTSLYLNDCKLEDISNLSFSELDKLQQIELSTNAIKQIPKLKMPKLKKIILICNQVAKLQKMNHSDLPAIQDLNLDQNLLDEFPILTLPTLKQISLAQNPLKNLKGLAKNKMNNLEFLSVSNCLELTDTQFPVLDLPKVTSITLSCCNITSLENLEKSKLPKLESLVLETIPISSLPKLRLPQLSYFSYTGYLYYESREDKVLLKDISKLSKWECPELIGLTIRYSDVQQIPIMKFPKLSKLEFDNNQIVNVSGIKQSELPELCEVNLSSNPGLTDIAVIPNNCMVDSLNLSQCQLGVIPDQEDWKCKNLYLSNCKITSIGKFNLSQTEYLSLEFNEIEDISLFMRDASKLQMLYLSGNRIKEIPDIAFPQLSSLTASNNMIVQLTLSEKNFPSLTYLSMDSNEIATLRDVSAPQLSSLLLSNNKISTIECFKRDSPIKLSQLKLENNEITKIDCIPATNYIYLANNKLKNLNWVPISHPEEWSTVDFNHNQIEDVSGLFHKDNKFNLLSSLSMDTNNIKNVTFNGSFPSLSYLSLNENKIQNLDNISPQVFPCLDRLSLTSNKIKKFGPNITLKKLYTLELSCNELEEIKGINSPSLTDLNLHQCKIKNLDWLNRIQWPELTNFTASANQITTVPKLNTMPKLNTLYIEENPVVNVDDFVSKYSDNNLGPYVKFTLKFELSLQLKEEIKSKIKRVASGYECTNPELQEKDQENDMEQKKQPAVLEIDDEG